MLKNKCKTLLSALTILCGLSGLLTTTPTFAWWHHHWGWGPGPVFAGVAAGAAIGYMAASPGPYYPYGPYAYYPAPYPYGYADYPYPPPPPYCRRAFWVKQCFRDHWGRPIPGRCVMVRQVRWVC